MAGIIIFLYTFCKYDLHNPWNNTDEIVAVELTCYLKYSLKISIGMKFK